MFTLQNPCDYMYQYYYDDCNGGAYLNNNNNNNFVPKCEEGVCLESCKSHFGYNEGVCFNNECYCRNQGMDWTHQNQKGASTQSTLNPFQKLTKFLAQIGRQNTPNAPFRTFTSNRQWTSNLS